MNIGICAFPLSKGRETGRGLERVVEEFCNYLSNQKIPFSFYDRGIIRSEFKAVLQSIGYVARLRRAHHDCYFATYPVAGIFPALLRKKPLITAVHDLIPYLVKGFDSRLKYAIKRWCIRYSCTRSDFIIVGFSSTKKKVVELFKIDERKVFVVPYGVDHKTYYPDKAMEKHARRMGFLGEAKRAKGIDSLIKAFKVVLKLFPDASLVLASDGNELEEMKELARNTLPSSSYSFIGFIEESKMREFYNSVDIFVFPSRYGFGLSVLEAMACGTPAIVGATLDALDFLTDRDLLVNPDDQNDMVARITHLLADDEKRAAKRREAIETAENFSWDKMSEKYYKVCLESIRAAQST